jgi:hypothetical protein
VLTYCPPLRNNCAVEENRDGDLTAQVAVRGAIDCAHAAGADLGAIS